MTSLDQGLIYLLPVIAVFLTSRVIAFDDLTIEGSFGIGGAVLVCGMAVGAPMLMTIPAVFCAGALSGVATGWLHHHLKMNNLISGIVVTTALFSVALNLAGANASLQAHQVGIGTHWLAIISIFAMVFVTVLLRSEMGLLIRVLGKNPQLLVRLGKNPKGYRTVVLAIANGLTATGGALFVVWTGYFSIFSNVGTMVIALASLMIGEAVSRTLGVMLVAGALLYQVLFALVLELDLPPSWNSLIKAALIVILMAVRRSSHA